MFRKGKENIYEIYRGTWPSPVPLPLVLHPNLNLKYVFAGIIPVPYTSSFYERNAQTVPSLFSLVNQIIEIYAYVFFTFFLFEKKIHFF